MKRLLLPAATGGVPYLPFGAATSIASAFDAALRVQLYQPRTDDHVVDPMSWGLTSFASPEGLMAGEVEKAQAMVASRLGALGLSDAQGRFIVEKRPLTSWRELGRVSRVYDLSIVSREALAENAATAMEQLLFDSGRPMLLSPHDWSRPVGESIAIAWNRSSETSRLVSHSMGLLRHAREVHVIAIEDWFVDGPDGGELRDYLAANDVPVHLHSTGKAKAEFGYQILHETQTLGVDLLLKGAYTQSRITQVMFGGATRDILREARIPVLLAH
jgi:nucleotide-binding universal stress UspA family protein